MKSKVNVKSNYSIKKVKRVMRMKEEKFKPHTYEVYKVTGPNNFMKYFVSQKDAKTFVSNMVNTKVETIDIAKVYTEIKRIEGISKRLLEPKFAQLNK